MGRQRHDLEVNRRRFLGSAGATATAVLAGCSTSSQSDISTTSQNTVKYTTTEEKGLLEQTHQADRLDGVVQQLEQDSVPLNFVPADEDADYANSNVFDQYSTDSPNALTVELDLNQAIQQRHGVDPHEVWGEKRANAVQEFVTGVKEEDDEWVDSLYNKYLDMADGDDLLDLKEGIQNLDWDKYKDKSSSYDERLNSGVHDVWYLLEKVRYGAISSTHNQFKAHAFQGTEKNAGFDTFISDFRVPSHGLVPAIEHPTRKEDETDQQEAYLVETDQGEDQQIGTLENVEYRNSEPFNGKNEFNKRGGLYEFTAIENAETEIADSIYTSPQVQKDFVDFFKNPEGSPAYDHIDPMNTVAYIAEENIVNGELDGKIHLGSLGTDTISIRT